MGKRLPMEGECVNAVYVGSSSSFYWGNKNPDAYSWHKENADKKITLQAPKN